MSIIHEQLIPLIATLLGLFPVLLKWLSDRSVAETRRREIQQAKEQVEFWQVWLQAQREVCSDQRFADLKADIARRLDQLVSAQDEKAELGSGSVRAENQPTLIQTIVLAYFPHTLKGWILHTAFYTIVSFAALVVFGSAIPSNDPTANPSWDVLRGELDFVIPFSLFFGAAALILQRLANRAERRYLTRIREHKYAGTSQPNAGL
jgi:hypothetical protein